jgi:hypothetical protein
VAAPWASRVRIGDEYTIRREINPNHAAIVFEFDQHSEAELCETFHGFNGLASLRLEIVVLQVVSWKGNLHLKRTLIDIQNPMRFSIAYGRRCAASFHFDLRHRRGLQPQRRSVIPPEFGRVHVSRPARPPHGSDAAAPSKH